MLASRESDRPFAELCNGSRKGWLLRKTHLVAMSDISYDETIAPSLAAPDIDVCEEGATHITFQLPQAGILRLRVFLSLSLLSFSFSPKVVPKTCSRCT